MERYVFMKLRIANKDDFFNLENKRKIGTLYFEQSVTGALQKKPCYFTEETDKDTFRVLYTHNQIYVPVNPFDEVEIVEEKEALTTN